MGGSPWGGSEALWHAAAKHALAQGDTVFVSVYDWGAPHSKLKILEQDGAQIYFRKKFNPDAGTIEKVVRFIKKRKPSLDKAYQSVIEFKPNVVFISQGDTFDLALHHKSFYSLLKEKNIPYSFVCHSHSQYSFIPPKEIYPGAVEVFKNAKNIFFVSQRQMHLTERRLICKLTNSSIIGNPLNISIPQNPLPWPIDNEINMALVGNLGGSKGHDTTLEVLSSAIWKGRNWILNIYGEGDGKQYLNDLAQFYGIQDKIIFHGYVTDILKVWQQNHILLIPSAGEGLPISLTEAMACGRPAIVTDVGGNTELITEDESGFIAASPTVECFSAAMEKAWQHKNRWKEIGTRAAKKASIHLDKNPHIKLYELLKPGKLNNTNNSMPGYV